MMQFDRKLTQEELKEYASFRDGIKGAFCKLTQDDFMQKWHNLSQQIIDNLEVDPYSEAGISLGEACHYFIARLYAQDCLINKDAKYDVDITKQESSDKMLYWMDRAMDAYWRRRVDK